MATSIIPTDRQVRWVDITGTSGGSSAVDITALADILRPTTAMILGVLDLNATVSAASSLSIYPSSNRYGGSLVSRTGAAQPSTAFNLRIYYALI